MVHDVPDGLRDDPVLYNAGIAGAVSEQEYVAGLKAAGLVDIEVNKRIEFTSQLLHSTDLQAHIHSTGAGTCCSGSAPAPIDLESQPQQWYGRVWSLNFVGRKLAKAD